MVEGCFCVDHDCAVLGLLSEEEFGLIENTLVLEAADDGELFFVESENDDGSLEEEEDVGSACFGG